MAEKKSFVLRISPELFEAIQQIANQEFRSVNGQIEFVLTDYARKVGRKPPDPEPEEKKPVS
jgi:hypothetical protein